MYILCGVLNNTLCGMYILCGVLNNTFTKTNNLKLHRGVHTGERPYCFDVLMKHSVKHTV